jgi:hypothetical protein
MMEESLLLGTLAVQVGSTWRCSIKRQRIWTFRRRVLHSCHHRTQVQTWLRLAGRQVPAIYGPSGDVHWDEADPAYSVEAADRGG